MVVEPPDASQSDKPKKKFDRAEYQKNYMREYMRKRRAREQVERNSK